MQVSRADHLIQYSVERVSTHEKKPAIVFENGAKLVLDKKKGIELAELQGSRLLSIEDRGNSDQLFFVNEDNTQTAITLDHGTYHIYDPVTDTLVDPHAEIDPNADLPPDPSAERIKEEGTGGEEETTEQSGDTGE